MADVEVIANKARRLSSSTGKISDEDFNEAHGYAEELLALLMGTDDGLSKRYEHAPRISWLLKNEEFFTGAFESF